MENFNTVPDKGTFGGSVEVINQNFLLAQQEMENLRNLISPDTKFVNAVATAQTTSVTQVLPETGSTDTVYRVGSWDGIQYNDSVFSEYAWNGSAYIKLNTKSQAGEVYDISATHSNTKYTDLAEALSGDNVPVGVRRGGMSVKFVQSSDNKYVQYRLMSDTFNTTVANWQGVDNEPKAGSPNLPNSNGVFINIDKKNSSICGEILENPDGLIAISYSTNRDQKLLSGTDGEIIESSTYPGYGTSDYISLSPKDNNYVVYFGGVVNNPRFASFVIYDENYSPLYIASASIAVSPIQLYKYLTLDLPYSAKYIRFSYENGHSPSFFALPKERYDVNPYLESGWIKRLQDLDKISYTVAEQNAIFGRAINGYETTDYIPITNNGNKSYFIYLGGFNPSYTVMCFYDANHNVLKSVAGDVVFNAMLMRVVMPKGTAYIKFAKESSKIDYGLYLEKAVSPNDIISSITNPVFTENNNILWLGTSIPAGAQYPYAAAGKCGYNCINNAYAGSQLCWNGQRPSVVSEYSGRCLTATVAELEAMFRQDVTAGTITESTLETWKNKSYERSLIPYIDGTNQVQVSMIVLDHGFNDRNNIYTLMQDVEHIDWTSRDRSNFVGAFNYLMDKIQEINPTIKIVISGYFQNTYIHSDNPSNDYHSADICAMQELIATHYSFSIMKAWEHTQINNDYIAGTDDYIADFNAEYGTSYSKVNPDSQGNIKSMQIYCPDMVHPHSDLTGNCDRRLNAVYSRLLADLI